MCLFERVPTFLLWRCLFERRLPTLGVGSQAEKDILRVDQCRVLRLAAAYICRATRRAVIWGRFRYIIFPGDMCWFGELVLTGPVDLSFSNDDSSVTIEFPCYKRRNEHYRQGP